MEVPRSVPRFAAAAGGAMLANAQRRCGVRFNARRDGGTLLCR
jgi:hypothetical protein